MSIVLIIFRKGLFITVYLNLPLCYIVYYSLVLHLYVRNLNRIFLSQKRAVRIVTNSDFRGYSQPLFLDIYIALIRSMLHTLCFHIIIYYCHRFFLDLFVTSRHIHNYNTRTSPHFRSHACRTNPKQFTILFQGPKIWNSLRKSITVNFLLQSFKKC